MQLRCGTGIIFCVTTAMIREIFTLTIDKVPMQYYVRFDKDRMKFCFQATLKHKTAPSFTIRVIDGELIPEPVVDEPVLIQARQKVKEIVSDKIFDRL
jgi:hypothetical protein